MQPTHSFTVRYDEATVRGAVRAYAWRRFVLENRPLWFASAAMAGLTVFLAVEGDRSWLLGVFATVAALPFGLFGFGWRAHFVNTVGRYRRMTRPEARFGLDDDGVEISAEDGGATIRWSAVSEIWERPGAWMIFLAPNQFFLLPTAGVSPEALAFVREKAGRGGR